MEISHSNAVDASDVSIVLPAKNEAEGLRKTLPMICKLHPEAEVIVVNDGSDDDTEAVCREFGVNVVTHPQSMGNGAAIKTGARHATRDTLVFMGGDGQHNPKDIARLLQRLREGYDMVVGARSRESQASLARLFGNTFYNKLASWIVAKKIEDLTSGFRAVKAAKFKEFLYLLPNGFSYPTTSTMAFFRAGYQVTYLPIPVAKRLGKSHLNIMKDGTRFVLTIFKIGTLYSPLKVFLPISLMFFLLGSGNYAYT
jgi:glycosyltransferase involved in cell wall biosynthesis